jgi:hypothetical protein
MHYEVSRTPDGASFVVSEEHDVLTTVDTASAASDAIYVRVHRRAFELASLRGWSRVHAVTLDLDGARVLVAGPSGAGKTTLALRMLLDGAAVQGDESVLVHRSGASLAVPRAFHVKDGTAVMVPELLEVPGWQDLPRIHDVTVLDPTLVRAPWTLVEAPVDHVVLLERDPAAAQGTSAAIEPIPNPVVLEALVAHTFPLTESTGDLLRTLVGAVGRARGHRLRGPDPSTTFAALRGVLS